jgi:hypothetical protein
VSATRLGRVPERPRLPLPGPSYVREEFVDVGGEAGPPRRVRLGMSAPATDDDWWLTILWAADDDGVIQVREVGPDAGPPAAPPLFYVGPAFSGALSGLVTEIDGRQALRLRLPPPADEARPWDRPLLLQVAVRWEPMRAATMTGNQLAREVLRAFGQAVRSVGHAR